MSVLTALHTRAGKALARFYFNIQGTFLLPSPLFRGLGVGVAKCRPSDGTARKPKAFGRKGGKASFGATPTPTAAAAAVGNLAKVGGRNNEKIYGFCFNACSRTNPCKLCKRR